MSGSAVERVGRPDGDRLSAADGSEEGEQRTESEEGTQSRGIKDSVHQI